MEKFLKEHVTNKLEENVEESKKTEDSKKTSESDKKTTTDL